jgi:hypothetical protein
VSPDVFSQTDDLTAAGWIAPRLGAFGSGVQGVIPAGFEAYARILHPAESSDEEPVRWSAVAGASDKVAHGLMQFHTLVGIAPTEYNVDSGAWTGTVPDHGNLEPDSLAALLDVLARHTDPSQRCWFCLWDGYGWPFGTEHATRGGPSPTDFDARVELPHRNYVLFGGPLAGALEVGHWPSQNWFLPHSPNIFWPNDLSWCVASEIDLFCTYVGGSRALIDDLLADERLEVWEAHLNDPIAHDSDLLNS